MRLTAPLSIITKQQYFEKIELSNKNQLSNFRHGNKKKSERCMILQLLKSNISLSIILRHKDDQHYDRLVVPNVL